MTKVILRPPTYAELEEQVQLLKLEIQELESGGRVVALMMSKLLGQYKPATLDDCDTHLTTEQIVRNMSAIIPGIGELNVVNAMMNAGFIFDQVDGQYYWLLRGV